MRILSRVYNSLKNRINWFKKKSGFFWIVFRMCPIVKKKIVISSYLGRGFSDNPKYIVEELLSRRDDLEIIWLLSDMKDIETLPLGVHGCKIDSKEAAYHSSSALIWIDNTRKDYFYKKNKQLYIQTWHGGGGTKIAEKDAENKLSKSYLRFAKRDSKAIDLLISDGVFSTNFFKRAFWYTGKIAEIGSPRNDIFKKDECTAIKEKVHKYFSIPNDVSIILYAPTFRNDESLKHYNIDFELLINSCKQRFKKDYVVLMRLHPNIAYKSSEFKYGSVIYDASKYLDTQELLVSADIVVSDYSSIMFDFLMKDGIALRYAPDVEEYMNERGFYFAINEYPFPIATNNSDLEKIVLNFDINDYQNKTSSFLSNYGVVQKNASSICADIIEEYISGKANKEKLLQMYSEYIR